MVKEEMEDDMENELVVEDVEVEEEGEVGEDLDEMELKEMEQQEVEEQVEAEEVEYVGISRFSVVRPSSLKCAV